MANANGVEEIITSLYEMIQDAWSLPLGAEKCVIERDKALDLLDEISNQLPGEIRPRPLSSPARRSLPTPSARRRISSSRQSSAPSR